MATESTTEKPEGIVGTLGLKSDVFLAQLINFLIILFVLWRWAYKPIVAMLESREKRIQSGLDNADAVEKHLKDIEKEHAAALASARAEAATFLQDAHKVSEQKRQETLDKARDEVAKLVTDARKNIATERDEAAKALKKEIAALVATTAELVLSEKIDAKKDAVLMHKVAKKK
jgi:F-type H+-transporting ATPase subunit b